KPKPDRLVASLVTHDLSLASAKEPSERAAALKKIDDELARERQSLTGNAQNNELVVVFDDWRESVVKGIAQLDSRPTVNVVTSISVSAKADATRVQQLRRNRDLIGKLVKLAVQLAAEPQLFKRVELCSSLADQLVSEIRTAASDQDGGRAVEM